MSEQLRREVRSAETALRAAGDIRHARAIRKLLNSHSALTAQARIAHAELAVLRQRRPRR